MINVILVDDDYAQRMYLKKIIPWKNYGFEIIEEASDGIEAFKKIKELTPHLVFIDVDMPSMNGLELLKKINVECKNIKTVIVSGHNNFNYAQEAIEFGAKHYILKPVDEDELLEVITKIHEEIKMEKKKKFELDVLYQKLDQSIPLLREKFLHDLVLGKIDCPQQNFHDKIKLLDINLIGQTFMTGIIEIDDIHNSLHNEKNREILKIAIKNISEDILGRKNNYVIFNDISDKITIIIESIDKTRKATIDSLFKIKEQIFDETNIKVTIGCGNIYPLIEVHKSYNESSYILKSKIFRGCNCILDYTECKTIDESYISLSYQYREQILIYFRHREIDKLNNLIKEILLNYKNNKITLDYMRIISLELITVGITYLATIGCSLSKLYGNNYNPLEQLLEYNSLEGLRNYICSFFMDIFNFTEKLNMPKLSIVVSKAKEFINHHYMISSLSLENIASELYVHPVYLSSLFKKETGEPISKYILELKMKKSMEIINSNPELNIIEIAARVGYENPYYFSKSFKKYYNLSPSEIKKTIQTIV